MKRALIALALLAPAIVYAAGRIEIDGASSLSGSSVSVATMTVTGTASGGNCLAVDGTTLVADCLNNRVGVGTASPSAPFTVQGSDTYGGGMALKNASGSDVGDIFVLSDDLHIRNSRSSARAVVLETQSNNETMTITGGKVGIGTASPQSGSKLHVYEGGSGATLPTNNGVLLEVAAGSNGGIGIAGSAGGETGLFFHNASSAWDAGVVHHTNNRDIALKTSGTTRLHINSGGNVGIGATSPSAPLHIKNATPRVLFSTEAVTAGGSEGFNADLYYGGGFASFNGRTDRFQLRADLAGNSGMRPPLSLSGAGIEFCPLGDQGSVCANGWTSTGLGLGTASPNNPLHIRTGTDRNLQVRGEVQYPTAGASIQSLADDNVTYKALEIEGSPILLSRGNVGIGSTDPQEKLDVRGSVYMAGSGEILWRRPGFEGWSVGQDASGWYVYNSTESVYRLRIGEPGDFSITGATTFGSSVTVSGSAQVGAQTTGSNIFTIGGAPADDSAAYLRFAKSNTVKSWQVAQNHLMAGALEFTPSTVAGGLTFTTPVMRLLDGGASVMVPSTFGSSVTVKGGAQSDLLLLDSTNGGYMTFSEGATIRGYAGVTDSIGGSADGVGVRSQGPLVLMSGGANPRLTLESAGAATFGSSVTVKAALGLNSGGTYEALYMGPNAIVSKTNATGQTIVQGATGGVLSLRSGAGNDNIRVGPTDGVSVDYPSTFGSSVTVKADAVFQATTTVKQFVETVTDVGASGTSKTVDWTLGSVSSITLSGNCTFTFTGGSRGQSMTLLLVQDGVGSRTATWPGNVSWPAATAPTLTTTAGKMDIISFFYDGVKYLGFTGGQNYTP